MFFALFSRLHPIRIPRNLWAFIFLLVVCASSRAASIRGVVTDASGAKVTGAKIVLMSNGRIAATAVSMADGSFQILAGGSGRYFLLVSAPTFRQLLTPDFYAGQFDSIERKIVLEPEWARESIVVTATGTPTPQPQTSAATTVLGPLDLALRTDAVGIMRMMPGIMVVQEGQRGAQTSLFVRGGDSDDNKVLLDGIDVGDLGNQFDPGPFSSIALESAEVYRGPNSNLFGSDAMTSVISFTTPHGTTSFPSIEYAGDIGNFQTTNQRLQIAGAHNRLDYFGAFNWLQTSNALPNDEHHAATTTANLGWQPSGSTQIRGTLHYGVLGTGVPNAWDFYHLTDDATEKDQDLFASGSIDNQTTAGLHNSVRYGLTRKREQYNLWQPTGQYQPYNSYCYGPAYLGQTVTITGANGYSTTGRAVLDCGSSTPGRSQNVSNRDQLTYRGDFTITPHLVALIGFQYEDERGAEPGSTYYLPVERSNYDYIAGVHGDFKGRLFYTLGGSLEHYSLFGVQTSPRAGASFYALKPRNGVFSGTRILFNFGDAVREPKLTDQEESLYYLLQTNGGQSTIQQLNISQLAAPTVRTYEGGVEQSFLRDHVLFKVSYFHNQFGREIEYVGLALIPELLPNLTAQQQEQLEAMLQVNNDYGLTTNSEAFRAQGLEANVESGIGKSLFFRGGYTYLDSVIQRSFTNDYATLLGPIPTFTDGTPIGPYSPLKGARPFRRPPHTGFFSATYAERKITAQFTSSFASRSDDSTYLEDMDANGGNSLLLPNRNLDHAFARLDLGGSYRLLSWLALYAQTENLLSQQHIAPIGYPSLPMNFRAGVRIDWGAQRRH